MNPTQKQFSLNHVASRKQIPISFTNLRHQLSAILLVIAIQGCTYQPPKYITTADTPKLAALKGKTVALVSVAYHTNESIGLKDIGTAGASFLLDRHSAVIQKEFGSLFRFQTSTNIHPLSLHKPPLKVSDAQQMRQLIQQLNGPIQHGTRSADLPRLARDASTVTRIPSRSDSLELQNTRSSLALACGSCPKS